MKSDVRTILFDGDDTVTMPLEVYEEMRMALRAYAGETDLPWFSQDAPAAPAVTPFDNLSPLSADEFDSKNKND